MERIKVLYIIGYGRSGSTILDALLSMHSQISGFGEIVQLPRLGWLENEYDASGQRCRDVPFWQAVFAHWTSESGDDVANRYVALQKTLLTRHSALRWPRRLPATGNLAQYVQTTGRLMRAIQAVAATSVIVDSSKSPTQALALAAADDIDLRLLHLVRDARAVAHSLGRPLKRAPDAGVERELPGHPPLRSALAWSWANILSEWVWRRAGVPTATLRYEDLFNRPHQVLKKISELLALDLTSLLPYLTEERPISFGHQIAGNRVRLRKDVILAPDESWRQELTLAQRMLVGMAAGPLMIRHGYLG
jgi:hypothetical protein